MAYGNAPEGNDPSLIADWLTEGGEELIEAVREGLRECDRRAGYHRGFDEGWDAAAEGPEDD